MLDSGNVDAADGALDALFKACMLCMPAVAFRPSLRDNHRFVKRMPAIWTTTFRVWQLALPQL